MGSLSSPPSPTSYKAFFMGGGSAILCALCCSIPFVLIFIGVNTIGLYLFLSQYQILLWILSGVLLIVNVGMNQYVLSLQGSCHDQKSVRWKKIALRISFGISLVLLYLSYSTAPLIVHPGYTSTPPL